MAENLETVIRKELVRYLARRISIRCFQERFAALSWNIEGTGEAGAIELAHEVEGLLAEATSAEWTEDELREEMEGIARSLPLPLESSNVVLEFTSARKSIRFEVIPRAYSHQETQIRHCA